MFHKVLIFFQALRRSFSRSEWAIRLLHLSVLKSSSPGLVMIQIDGLSQEQFEKAKENGRLPFLGQLIKKEHYKTHSLYSGLPASTPAMQGELFYGVKGCVPEFSFLDKTSGRIVKMYEPAAASMVQKKIERQGMGLLEGGSSYSNVFTGGASESHFCAADIGWGGFFRAANPLVFPVLFVLYLDVFVRTFALLIVEFFLAVVDCLRGTIGGKLFKEELRFIPTRVAVCVLLRELVAAGGAIDIARGLPVIHMNFLGYDEQAHRRGPSSLFAHWSLRGIGDAIKRLWEAAHRSSRREYDVWIYSDHGQEDARSYSAVHGLTLREALSKIYPLGRLSFQTPSASNLQRSKRADFLRFFFGPREYESLVPDSLVAAMGPVGNIYLSHRLNSTEQDRFAVHCLRSASIPHVLAAVEKQKAIVWSEKGKFTLPEDAEAVFGLNHPFFEDIAKDLVELCHHPDAGDFVILGWDRNGCVTSFMVENGTHAGPGVHETGAFALLPQDAPLPRVGRNYLRPLDLREGALHFLCRTPPAPSQPRKPRALPVSLRVMTYNIHSSIGMDGKVSHDRIARVIARHDADVIALQELDVRMDRTGALDQAGLIAKKLEMSHHFHPSFFIEDGQFGNAVFSHFPMKLVGVKRFKKNKDLAREESRGAIWILMDVQGIPVNLITTHLSVWPKERLRQADQLCKDWLETYSSPEPLVLCGDFNALPGSAAYRRFKKCLRDAQKIFDPSIRPRNTWFGEYPFVRIDHVFVNSSVQVTDVRVPSTRLERVASDHLPLLVELRLHRGFPGSSSEILSQKV